MGVSSVFTVRPRTSSLCSPLILDQNGFRFASIGVFFKILRRKQSHCPGCKRPAAATIARVSSPKSLDLGKQSHCLGCKRPAPATITRIKMTLVSPQSEFPLRFYERNKTHVTTPGAVGCAHATAPGAGGCAHAMAPGAGGCAHATAPGAGGSDHVTASGAGEANLIPACPT
ncbi:hypothetical protein Rs2_38540 [Raphanus sativus]|nr:hypothetical protein Rs2_38540 [Raphanus sativus]